MWDNHVPVGDMTHNVHEGLISRCDVGEMTQRTLQDTLRSYPPIYLYSRVTFVELPDLAATIRGQLRATWVAGDGIKPLRLIYRWPAV